MNNKQIKKATVDAINAVSYTHLYYNYFQLD